MSISIIEWGGAAVLFGGLACLSVIDWRSYRLPNILTKPLIVLGLLYHFNVSLDVYPYLLGTVLGYAIFWCVEHGYRILRKQEGLGRGDAKLLALGGAWCGAMALPFIILIASASALIYVVTRRAKDKLALKLPFGPFLSAAISAVFIGLKFI